ncbi:MAG: malto-oligosyltrehalose trehalohydrolase [Bowdeniella nasicola]|nr:malto-oligosyltrehalose trehalohydrolase [Bowdeniella nasicola]
MIPVRVWAPRARRVDLIVEGTARAMSPEPGDWYAAQLPAGTRYAFSLDGGPARPDPRSAYQPEGVHGPSEVVDTSAFAWTDRNYQGVEALGAVMYELHVGTFTPQGTLRSAIERLDYLKDLGVTMVELMPLAAFPGRAGWGYDGVALWSVHEAYGGPRALQEFVDAAHARGLGVCLDVVHNHLGPSGNYLGEFGPYFTDRHHTPWGAAVNLDGDGSHEVRRFIIDSCLRWFSDFHVDALRLDAVHALIDESHPHLLAQLSDEVAALRDRLARPLSLIAESDLNDVSMVTPTARGGLGMDAQWDDDVHHALHAWLTGERHGYYGDFGDSETLAKAFTEVFVHNGTYSSFREKIWGRPVPAEVDRRRFVTFTENHDQVGNRGMGDRPSERHPLGLVAGGAALVLLSPFTPMIFQGQEFAASTPFPFFTDHDDDELAEAVRRGRREEFARHGWAELYGADASVPDPQSPSTFERAHLRWEELDQDPHRTMLAWFRRLIQVRARLEEMPRPHTAFDYGRDWCALRRADVVVAVNRAEEPVHIHVGGGDLDAAMGEHQPCLKDGVLQLPGRSSALVLGVPTSAH